MRKIAVAVALTLIALVNGAAHAGLVDGCTSTFGIWARSGYSCGSMTINICPMGDFEPIASGCIPYTAPGSYAIEIFARDASGNPIPGIPWTDYWLNSCDPNLQLALCTFLIASDSLTGPDGRTTFSGRIAGGGCNIPEGSLTGQGIWMAIQGQTLMLPDLCVDKRCVAVNIKSPDINGPGGGPDGVVNLYDLSIIAIHFNTEWGVPSVKGFNACVDFNDDNKVNLIDFSMFIEHYQHECQ